MTDRRTAGTRQLWTARTRLPPTYTVVLAAAWVVAIFALSTSPLPHLWRPLAVAVIVAGVAHLLLWAALGRGHRGHLAGGIGGLLVIGAWPFAAAIALLVAWRAAVTGLRRRRGGAPAVSAREIIGIANRLAVIMLVVAIATTASAGGFGVLGGTPTRSGSSSAPEGAPDIYFVLLDGYPRADTLTETFGVDNGPFLDDLAARGFDVAAASRSNYTKTIMTLASVLNMRYVDDIDALGSAPADAAGQTRRLSEVINRSEGVRALVEHGYTITSIGGAFGETALITADTFRESGAMTRFEEQVARFTWLGSVLQAVVPDLMPSQHRQAIQGVLSELAAAESAGRPQFVLAHVLAPHAPFLFNADGSSRPPPECFPESCSIWATELENIDVTLEEYSQGVREQLAFVNARLLDTVDRLVAREPDAVIVLFSDHGLRYSLEDPGEWIRNFIAVRSPGDDDPVPDDASPVNLLPLVLNAQLGMDLPVHPYRGFCSGPRPLDTVPVEPGFESACLRLNTE